MTSNKLTWVAAAISVTSTVGALAAAKAPVGVPPRMPEKPEAPVAAAEHLDHFEKHVRPLLVSQCYNCHSGLTAAPLGGLRLDSREFLLKGGKRGPSIDLANPERSLLLRSVTHAEAGLKMPPSGKLAPAQIAQLARWVKAGAPWPSAGGQGAATDHWAFQAVKRPAVPVVKDRAWVRTPIDSFVLAELEKQGLRPAPPADRRTLIRRATFDLTGLPPTPAEVEAFLKDPAPNAWEKVVDRLLASPRYGEKWGRRWLDVARYADSNGLDENLHYANAWRYRDYVIDAFNRNVPFDQFVREQIAGDLLPRTGQEKTDNDRLVATGFLALGPKMLAEDDPVKMELDIIDEQLDTVGKAFMGLTLGCARCHDHKYDPVSQKDYYGLAGILKSTKTMENFSVVAVWHENVLASQADQERQRAHEQKIAEKRKVLEAETRKAHAAYLAGERQRATEYALAAARLVRQGDAKLVPLAPGDGKPLPAGVHLVEAENYIRGNVRKDYDTYGAGIGVLVNQGQFPNFTEYELEVPAAGPYQVDLRYAAAQARPVRLLINGSLVRADVAGGVTGSWGPDGQKWFAEGVFSLKAGKNVLRLERTGQEPFPHIDKLAVGPFRLPDGVESYISPEQLAQDQRLSPALLRQWAAALKRIGMQPEHPLAAWLKGGPLTAVGVPAAVHTLASAGDGPFAMPAAADIQLPATDVERLKGLQVQVESLEKSKPDFPRALGVREGKPTDLKVHIRGNYQTLGEPAPRGFLRAVSSDARIPEPDRQSGRLQLTEWLTSPSHPLTARVFVNRVWLGHFGEGLVRSPDNFGKLGERPSHPALLDWLASVFAGMGGAGVAEGVGGQGSGTRGGTLVTTAAAGPRRSGNSTLPYPYTATPGLSWDVKALHRLIMVSNAYRMSTAYDSNAAAKDPENRLLWRMNRRRLDAEEIRDGIVAVTGSLDLTTGGSMLPLKNREYVTSTANRDTTDYNSPRRAVYLPVVRSSLYDVFTAFDFGDPSVVNGQRTSTTVAPQALFMLNGDLMARQTRKMAEVLLKEMPSDDRARVAAIYERVVNRPARPAEVAKAIDFVGRVDKAWEGRGVEPAERRVRAWQSLCRVVVASNEFLFVE